MRSSLTEKDRRQTFGIRVKLPVALINYRSYEVSLQGIEEEIKTESMDHRRKKLFKIRNQMRKILSEL